VNDAYWSEDMDEAAEEGHEGQTYDEILHETEKGIRVRMRGKEVWLPKSQIEICKKDRWIRIPMWLRDRHGIR
jgi:hypothetical protein